MANQYIYNEPPDFPEPPADFGEPYFDGDELQERHDLNLAKVFIVDRAAEHETKSKDRLEIHYNRKASDEHFSTAWSPTAAVYSVDNLTKREKGKPSETYSVAFYRSKSGELILSSCDCPARLRCKHIIHAWRKHADAENTGFVPTI